MQIKLIFHGKFTNELKLEWKIKYIVLKTSTIVNLFRLF